MARAVETEGDSVEQAVEAALEELGAARDDVDIEVLEEAETKGFLGIRRGGKARVLVRIRTDAKAVLQEVGEKILSMMELHGRVTVSRTDEGGMHVDMEGEEDDLGLLIGRHGQTLEALQTILGVTVNRAAQERIHVTLDIEGYRQRRREELTELASRVARKAVSTGQPVVLRPMTPFERKVVHLALHEDAEVETRSDGEEPYRRITVEPVG